MIFIKFAALQDFFLILIKNKLISLIQTKKNQGIRANQIRCQLNLLPFCSHCIDNLIYFQVEKII